MENLGLETRRHMFHQEWARLEDFKKETRIKILLPNKARGTQKGSVNVQSMERQRGQMVYTNHY